MCGGRRGVRARPGSASGGDSSGIAENATGPTVGPAGIGLAGTVVDCGMAGSLEAFEPGLKRIRGESEVVVAVYTLGSDMRFIQAREVVERARVASRALESGGGSWSR